MDKQNSEYQLLPLGLHRYVASVADWFTGFAKFTSVPQPIKTDTVVGSLDDLVSAKVDKSKDQVKLLLSLLGERKLLNQSIITRLEELKRACKDYIRPLVSVNNFVINDLAFRLLHEIFICEKEIIKEELASWHDRFYMERSLLVAKQKWEDQLRWYHWFQEM